jgi:hypothetical protein
MTRAAGAARTAFPRGESVQVFDSSGENPESCRLGRGTRPNNQWVTAPGLLGLVPRPNLRGILAQSFCLGIPVGEALLRVCARSLPITVTGGTRGKLNFPGSHSQAALGSDKSQINWLINPALAG